MSFVGDYFELPVIKEECVGIEVELENVLNPDAYNSKYWRVVGDGSLRNNGVEFLSNGPTPYAVMQEAMQELAYILSKYPDAEASCRTGLHVHINVSDMTYDQVKAMILLSVLVEPGLIWHCGEDRASNIYSLASSRGDCILSNIQNLINANTTRKFRDEIMRAEGFKYSALNIGSICNKGTVEYRMHRGTKSIKDIEQWTSILVSLRRLAIDMGDAPAVLNSLDYIREYVTNYGLSPSCITRKSERRGRLLLAPVNTVTGYRESPAPEKKTYTGTFPGQIIFDEAYFQNAMNEPRPAEDVEEDDEEGEDNWVHIERIRAMAEYIRESLPAVAFTELELDDVGYIRERDVYVTGMRTSMTMQGYLTVRQALGRQQQRLVRGVNEA